MRRHQISGPTLFDNCVGCPDTMPAGDVEPRPAEWSIYLPRWVTDTRERALLAAGCEPWVTKQAARYAAWMFPGPRETHARDEFKAAGRMGVVIALNKFDLRRGVKFFTYARSWVTQQIQYRAKEFGRQHQKLGPVASLDTAFEDAHERAPSQDLEVYDDSDGPGWTDEDWHSVLRRLPERSREVVRQRFVEEKTLAQIGAIHGISKERVRQILDDAFASLERDPWLKLLAGDE